MPLLEVGIHAVASASSVRNVAFSAAAALKHHLVFLERRSSFPFRETIAIGYCEAVSASSTLKASRRINIIVAIIVYGGGPRTRVLRLSGVVEGPVGITSCLLLGMSREGIAHAAIGTVSPHIAARRVPICHANAV